VDPRKAREWVNPPREPLFWAPCGRDDPTEESWTVTVEELVEYEPLLFSPPRGAETLFKGEVVEIRADYTPIDLKSTIGYR